MCRVVFQFRLWRFPISVHFSHLIVSGLIAWSFAQAPRTSGGGWPDSVLAQPGDPRHSQTVLLVVLLWMAMISLSVLVHELGHATVARSFGYPAHIQLIGLGGQTWAEGGEGMPWHQDVLHTLAGPAAGLALGVTAGKGLLGWNAVGEAPALVSYTLHNLFYANLAWTALNLMPLASLDGGRIASAVLTRLFGRSGFLSAQILSLLLALGFFIAALMAKDFLLLALVFLLGTRTYSNLAGWYRGELPRGQSSHPLVAQVEQAEQAFRDGKLDEAERAGRGLVGPEAPPMVRSRANLLLGWVLLKRGQGREALARFHEVRDRELPPHALAAALSLSGDEVRALPLWAQAAQQSGNEVILHEFAGALIRAGREADARRLVGVRMELAWASAERVYYVRGEYEQAAQMAEAAFREEPSFSSAYDAACAYSRAKQPVAAMRMLALASQNGFRDAAKAEADPDLQGMRELPEFREWMEGIKGP